MPFPDTSFRGSPADPGEDDEDQGIRQTLEKMMKTKEYGKTFIDRIHDDGIAEGEAKGKAEDVLKLLDRRGLAPSEEQRGKVAACTDTDQLDLWFDRAITAATADEVFAA